MAKLLHVLSVMEMVLSCKHAQSAMETVRFIAMIATELDVKTVLGASEGVERNVSLAVALVGTDVTRVLAVVTVPLVTSAHFAGAEGIKIVAFVMVLAWKDVILVGEKDMKTAQVAMVMAVLIVLNAMAMVKLKSSVQNAMELV